MTVEFEELDYQETPMGCISLRRRSEPRIAGKIVYEVKLGDEFLMSSLFIAGETELARRALAALEGVELDVVVGGLGLGYTAVAVLENPAVRSLVVIELLKPVIDWHRRGLVPVGNKLAVDPRSTLTHADFFDTAALPDGGFDRAAPDRLAHAVLLDIDHSPKHWLDPANSAFYTPRGIQSVADKLHSKGIFGLWSNDAPDDEFMSLLDGIFQSSDCHIVRFANPYTGGESSSTVYLARKA